MTNTSKVLIVFICVVGCFAFASAQSAPQSATPAAAPARVAAADAKDHVGETVMVCGKVVDVTIGKYGIGGHGKPVLFDIDVPQPDPVFYFVTFGSKEGGPDEAVAAYKGKSVCVTGKVTLASGQPFIMAADRTQIKPKAD